MPSLPLRSSALTALLLLCVFPLPAQIHITDSGQQTTTRAQAQPPHPPKAPALIDAAGPTVSLEDSEALFDVAAALNSCGYDGGLAQSDPLRMQVRAAVNQAFESSAAARGVHDELCTFINQHRLFEGSRDLAQYVSLALYLTPPPDLALSVEQEDVAPDATQVEDLLPILRRFADALDLHLIWLRFHPDYEAEIDKLHDPLTRMILNTNIYLKLPLSTASGRRFLVVLEPLLDPNQTNSRVYGSNYVVVAAPVQGKINMQDVRHTYLHYVIEPLLYQHADAMDRLLPLLKVVRDAPLDYEYRGNIASLVIECLIRAIEARTMETGVQLFVIPATAPRADLPRLDHERELTLQQDEAVREKKVQADMSEGFVMTQYFFTAMTAFERSPESLTEAIGPMVYGMDVDQQISRAKQITFAQQAAPDVVQSPTSDLDLEQAEAKIRTGDAEGASKLAMKAIEDHTGDPAFANYLMALTWLMKGDPESATNDFDVALKLTQDPRLLAWSHIWLGRIDDVQGERDQAVDQYRAAMTVRDGQPDTLEAAQMGLKAPYTLARAQGSP